MRELLVDRADQIHRNHIKLIREERLLSRYGIYRLEEVRNPVKILVIGNG